MDLSFVQGNEHTPVANEGEANQLYSHNINHLISFYLFRMMY